MPFDWQEYLRLAEKLLENPGAAMHAEAAGRSAVSRAYYSVYCSVRNYASAHDGYIPLGESEDHKLLVQHFDRTNRGDVARQLQQLRRWRNDADYADTLVNVSAMAKNAISEAHRVRNKIEAAAARGRKK